jgi:hypothetical protein
MKAGLAVVTLLLVALLSLAAGFGPYRLCQGLVDLVGDKLEWRARSLAGPQGVNCGRVESGHDARAANDCVRKSLGLGRAMRVRYEVPGIDSTGSTALVRSPQGHVYEIVLDGNPGHAGPTSLFRQRIAVKECSTELQIASGGRLTCIHNGGL